jgi:hypothetical protein
MTFWEVLNGMMLMKKALFCFIHTSTPEFISALTFCFSGNLWHPYAILSKSRIRLPMLSFEVGHTVSNLFG